ncbi:MAG TPA: hypothetical protein VGH54_15730 [Mycobacterium sp.]|jgi:hypothetical protein|uniref:hypothetical protein n=1 Tax=Mycobacterium sp. TaxID=1785 RepID=UPI002F3F566F
MNGERPELTTEESDAARHLMDAVNIHVQASRASGREKPGWVAIRLQDGKSPTGDLYDTQSDAARFSMNDSNVFYVKVGKDTMGFREALIQLRVNRQARARGVVFTRETVVAPMLIEGINEMLRKGRRA